MMTGRRLFLGILLISLFLPAPAAKACESFACATPSPEVNIGSGAITAGYVDGVPGQGLRAAHQRGPEAEFSYRLVRPCDYTDVPLGGCEAGIEACAQVAGRVINQYYVLAQRLVQED